MFCSPGLGKGREWQPQPHDHVLREEDRLRDAFARFCFYTLANPARAGLVTDVAADVRRRISPVAAPSASSRRRLPGGDWPYRGAIVPGYPKLHPMAEDYWELFWKFYATAREAEPPPAS